MVIIRANVFALLALARMSMVTGQYNNCTGELSRMGDGYCDASLNNLNCGYDEGDCCICSCVSNGECSFSDFSCVDPSAADHLYQCQPQPPSATQCSADVAQKWFVDNSTQARALANAVSCSGGYFNVEWVGLVTVEQTIYISDGTVLNIAGAGGSLSSVIDGDLQTRLFTVINASLHLSDISLEAGSSIVGGAVAAYASNITLTRTSFFGNKASGMGGAIYLTNKCIAFFNGNGTTLFNNIAVGGGGGAVYASSGSTVRFSGETQVLFNTAGDSGGAIAVDQSQIVWDGEAFFTNNTCGSFGGAVDVANTSNAAWIGNISFLGNTAATQGGALMVRSSSAASWSGAALFERNSAQFNGGALAVIFSSSVSWSRATPFVGNWAAEWGGDTIFINNVAGESGGAVSFSNASGSWSVSTWFLNNSALTGVGGAIKALGSSVSWRGATSFLKNSATSGGGMYVTSKSNVSWSGPNTTFIANAATRLVGGAVAVTGSNISWGGSTMIWDNNAVEFGGGILMWNGTRIDWSGETTFARNKASTGGAIYIYRDVLVEWTGPTIFASNEADIEGGALGSTALDASADGNLMSSLSIAGTTIFEDNVCGRDGGAMTLAGGLSPEFDLTASIIFRQNEAGVAGGAIFISGADIGPKFSGVIFDSNSAQLGGGIYVISSGNSKVDSEGEITFNPTVFYRCLFVGNTATATGGAIQSAAGEDWFDDSLFVGNTARAGGAVYLAGISYFFNCSFSNNKADEGAGPAVSNIGLVPSMQNSSFVGNAYNCETGTFRAYSTSDMPFAYLCVGCNVLCQWCDFEDASRVPYCEGAMTHSTSEGGSTTLGKLSIDYGYWRATESSYAVLACYNTDACLGGITGASGYCGEGYEGPYCAICSDGYTTSLGFTCEKCSNSASGVALAVVTFAAGAFAIMLLVRYLIFEGVESTQRGLVGRFMRFIPLQSIKIVIVAWQIVTQFASVANVTYPDIYQRFLDGVNVLNFDLSWVLSVGCVLDLDFYDRLLFATIGPIAAVAALGMTYGVVVLRNRGSNRALTNVQQKHLSAAILLTFFIYSTVSSILFQTFACDDLDDGNVYLRADYRIQCDTPKHTAFTVYAGFMTVLYAFGIPVLYAGLLFKDRELLLNDSDTNSTSINNAQIIHPRVGSTSNLWKPYKPKRFYYEVIECCRRILLTGAVVFIYPNTAAQIAVTLIIAFIFAIISEGLDPYASTWDTWVSRMGHVVVFVSVYMALLLKVDVSEERRQSQMVFEGILVLVHVFMAVAVLGEALVLVCSLRMERQRGPSPRFRRMRWIHRNRNA